MSLVGFSCYKKLRRSQSKAGTQILKNILSLCDEMGYLYTKNAEKHFFKIAQKVQYCGVTVLIETFWILAAPFETRFKQNQMAYLLCTFLEGGLLFPIFSQGFELK